jgi:hypothetical protein
MNPMKKTLIPMMVVVAAAMLATGCSWSVGGGKKSEIVQPTVGQQLFDLKKARDAGAINENEYETQKAKLLGNQ